MRHSFIIALLLLAGLTPLSRGESQKLPPVAGQFGKFTTFEHLTAEDGLSGNNVWSIAQDQDGFIWIATSSGLNRYDGSRIKVFLDDPDDPHSLTGYSVRNLHVDQAGRLWVGTWRDGLNLYHPAVEGFIGYRHDPDNPDSLSADDIRSLYGDRRGNLWVGTEKGGLNKLDPETGTFTRYLHDPNNPNSLVNNSIFSIYEDKAGYIWLCTRGGIERLEPETETFTHYPDDFPLTEFSRVYEDRRGRFWVSTRTGIGRFNFDTRQFTHYDYYPGTSVSNERATAITGDAHGFLWISSWGGGIRRFDPETGAFLFYQHQTGDPYSLSSNNSLSLYFDSNGVLWIPSTGGVNILDPHKKPFAHYRSIPNDRNSLSQNVTNVVYEDRSGVIWIGTNGGLNKWDRKTNTFTHYTYNPDDPKGVNNSQVISILEDQRGNVWVGTNGGLNKLDKKTDTFTHYTYRRNHPEGLSFPVVTGIYEDRAGILWLSTHGGGLNRFDPETETFRHYRHDPADAASLLSDRTKFVYQDRRGLFWIGTHIGMSRFDPATETFRHFYHRVDDANVLGQSIKTGVYGMLEDHQGVLWFGTGDGLGRFDPEKNRYTHYTTKEGLNTNSISGILEEDPSPGRDVRHLWLTTVKGLTKFNPETETFINYDKGDGLHDNTFSWENPAYKSHTGELIFGGSNGITVFDPHRIQKNPIIPPVMITDFQLNHKPVPIGANSVLKQSILRTDHITLSYLDRVFSFKFAALNYQSPGKNRYKYKMEGFDENWTEAGSERALAYYTNLDPGAYTFRVIASNNDGVWNERGDSVRITITSPWWETLWFRSLATLLVIGMAVAGYRWRVSSIKKRNRQLESKVSERTDQLLESNKELKKEIGERRQLADKVKENEEKLRTTLDATPFPVAIVDTQDDKIVYWSKSAVALFGHTAPTAAEWYLLAYPDPDYRKKVIEKWRAVIKGARKSGIPVNAGDYDVTCKDGSVRVCQLYATFIPENLIVTFNDITERKKTEQQVLQSLKEKEILLQEVHHRVKNNMQIIQSLLNLQSARLDDLDLKRAIQDSNNRIRSMALIHETLYRSGDFSHLNLEAYFQGIVKGLHRIYHDPEKSVGCQIDIDPVQLDMDQSIACGLIVNELVTNSLKYAFVDRRRGRIHIRLRQTKRHEAALCVSDNGAGMPVDGDRHRIDSLGLKIVGMLAEGQLNGCLDRKTENGVSVHIRFPVERPKEN
jgi:PAS domain S-box-containing protein